MLLSQSEFKKDLNLIKSSSLPTHIAVEKSVNNKKRIRKKSVILLQMILQISLTLLTLNSGKMLGATSEYESGHYQQQPPIVKNGGSR
ncbi:MAG: hypothetical protein AAFO04_08595 [Cyanobacteria bacterium J06592_8]